MGEVDPSVAASHSTWPSKVSRRAQQPGNAHCSPTVDRKIIKNRYLSSQSQREFRKSIGNSAG